MPESTVNITPGVGQKLHSFQRTVGANTVEDEVIVLGEQYLPSYSATFVSISGATANDHIIALMAGASLKLRIRRIRIHQQNLAAAASLFQVSVLRLTSAGSGGTAVTPRQLDPADPAAGATARTLDTVKGTEGVELERLLFPAMAAHPMDIESMWVQSPNGKPIVVPAGTANGIAIKVNSGLASSTLTGSITFDESSF